MQQHLYQDIYKGKPRELLIIGKMDSLEYRIFCEGTMIGILLKDLTKPAEQQWTTVYNLLKPIAPKIGKFIDQQS